MSMCMNRKFHDAASFLTAYLIPPKCPACGTLVPIGGKADPFCEACRGEWENETVEPCPDCGLSASDCVCIPKALCEIGVRDACFLSFYRAGAKTVTDRTVYRIKSEKDGRVFDFLAEKLAERIRVFCALEGIDPDRAVFTALPRRRMAIRETGFDQAVVLSEAIAREAKGTYRSLLKRTRGKREQKRLNAEERHANLQNAFALKKRTVDLTGKTVFLVDDIMTTGSGLAACAEALFDAGAERVVPVLIARTVKKRHSARLESDCEERF